MEMFRTLFRELRGYFLFISCWLILVFVLSWFSNGSIDLKEMNFWSHIFMPVAFTVIYFGILIITKQYADRVELYKI